MAVGRSALRDARNGETFCELCRDELELDVELFSGADEARLAYLGARSALGWAVPLGPSASISPRGLREGVLLREHSRRAPIQAA